MRDDDLPVFGNHHIELERRNRREIERMDEGRDRIFGHQAAAAAMALPFEIIRDFHLFWFQEKTAFYKRKQHDREQKEAELVDFEMSHNEIPLAAKVEIWPEIGPVLIKFHKKVNNSTEMTASEFIQSLPQKAKPEVLEGLSTIFHFEISGDGGGEFTVKVDDGKMSVENGLHGDPKCSVKSKAETLVKVVKGEENAMSAVMFGKIKISNVGEMMKYAKIFGLM